MHQETPAAASGERCRHAEVYLYTHPRQTSVEQSIAVLTSEKGGLVKRLGDGKLIIATAPVSQWPSSPYDPIQRAESRGAFSHVVGCFVWHIARHLTVKQLIERLRSGLEPIAARP